MRIKPPKTWPMGEWAGWQRAGKGQPIPVCVTGHTVQRGKIIVRKQAGGRPAIVSRAHLEFQYCVQCGGECPGGLLSGALCSECYKAKNLN